MKAKPTILKKLARDVWRTGQSISATARICSLPVGTVKAWRSRERWDRRDATPGGAGETPAHATPTHRGLSWQHLPGRAGGKKATFALFKRGMWPPPAWRVPRELTGGPLMMLLHERACAGQGVKRSRSQGGGR